MCRPGRSTCHPAPSRAARGGRDLPVTADHAAKHLRQLSTAARLAPISPRRAVEVQNPLIIRTARLVLRPLLESDQAEFLRVVRLSRDHLARFHPLHKGSETDEQLFARQATMSRAALATGLACRLLAFESGGRLVGALNLNDITSATERSAEVAYWLAADVTGRGYAREGLRALLDHAISPSARTAGGGGRGLGLSFVTALIAPENERARRAALAVGFVPDPRSPRVFLNLAGRWQAHDPYLFTAPRPLVQFPAGAGDARRATAL